MTLQELAELQKQKEHEVISSWVQGFKFSSSVWWPREKGIGCSLHTNSFACSCSGYLSPGGLVGGVWPHLSWPWYSLFRCLTHPSLHQVLLDTTMPSSPSQEDRVRPLYLGKRCDWLLPHVCDCLHSYEVHTVMFLYADVFVKKAWVSMYKNCIRACHGDIDLLTSTMIGHISMSVACPNYSWILVTLRVWFLILEVFMKVELQMFVLTIISHL